MTKTAVVICPGRGTYNKAELGYIYRHHSARSDLVDQFDAQRTEAGQDSVTELDGAARFSLARHTRGDAASALIYAASVLDAQAISESFRVVAVTGNSMGWYSALAVAGAVTPENGFRIANTMGTLMQQSLLGGQSLYPFVDENWVEIPGKRAALLDLVARINRNGMARLDVSIHLGGMLVVAGDAAGLDAFEAEVPPMDGRYPMRLPNHAAFHTMLQDPVAKAGRDALGAELFGTPQVAMVDGRGAVWYPGASRVQDLHAYTLDTQVVTAYDFTRAVQVAAKTFAPDVFILAGPGATLGSAVAQSLIGINWDNMTDKATFQAQQADQPVLLSMGREDQRGQVVAP